MSKRRKEAGKVVIKKRKRFTLPTLRLSLIIILALVVGTAVVSYAVYTSFQQPSETTEKEEPYELLAEVVDKKNPNITVNIRYRVRGSLPVNNLTLGIEDTVIFRVFYYEIEVPEETNETVEGNETAPQNRTITGIAAFYFKAPHLQHLFNLIGKRYSIENLSELIYSERMIDALTGGLYEKEELGEETVNSDVFGGEVKVRKVKYSFVLSLVESRYDIEIIGWHETRYGLPIKVVININNTELTFELTGILPGEAV